MKSFFFPVLMLIATIAAAQTSHEVPEKPAGDAVVHEGPVKWMSFAEAVEKSKTEKRKIFIDVYTDWCGWCKVMDKNTFSEPIVAKMLNEHYYAVKLDAEQKTDINVGTQVFKFLPDARANELALRLLGGKMSYPTVVFLDEQFNMIQPLPGYRKADEFHQWLTYYFEDYYKKGEEGVKEFQKNYKSPYPAAATPTTTQTPTGSGK